VSALCPFLTRRAVYRRPPTYQPTFAVLDAMGEHHTEADGGWGGLSMELKPTAAVIPLLLFSCASESGFSTGSTSYCIYNLDILIVYRDNQQLADLVTFLHPVVAVTAVVQFHYDFPRVPLIYYTFAGNVVQNVQAAFAFQQSDRAMRKFDMYTGMEHGIPVRWHKHRFPAVYIQTSIGFMRSRWCFRSGF
jgi:hypothetical protein